MRRCHGRTAIHSPHGNSIRIIPVRNATPKGNLLVREQDKKRKCELSKGDLVVAAGKVCITIRLEQGIMTERHNSIFLKHPRELPSCTAVGCAHFLRSCSRLHCCQGFATKA
jgi:hypothetical protein